MDTTASEATVNATETEKIDETQNDEKNDEIQLDETNTDNLQENQHQQRQDFTSENNKIEITNMGKFAFGVCNSFKFH